MTIELKVPYEEIVQFVTESVSEHDLEPEQKERFKEITLFGLAYMEAYDDEEEVVRIDKRTLLSLIANTSLQLVNSSTYPMATKDYVLDGTPTIDVLEEIIIEDYLTEEQQDEEDLVKFLDDLTKQLTKATEYNRTNKSKESAELGKFLDELTRELFEAIKEKR